MPATPLQQAFRQYVLDGHLRPGNKLDSEVALAARFGVPRAAMREVIMHFSHMGLLERTRNRGTFLRAVEPEQLEDDLAFCFQLSGFTFEELKETRLCLETAVAPLIVKRISPALLDELRANVAAMRAAQDQPATADLRDRDFHLLLLKSANNRTLKLFSQVIYLLFRKQFRERYHTPAAVAKSATDHEAILAAIIAGDAGRVQALLASHIQPT